VDSSVSSTASPRLPMNSVLQGGLSRVLDTGAYPTGPLPGAPPPLPLHVCAGCVGVVFWGGGGCWCSSTPDDGDGDGGGDGPACARDTPAGGDKHAAASARARELLQQ
jgi:hypothetical protein